MSKTVRRRCPRCRRSMRLAKLIRWHFQTEWLVCPHCDTYVKPSYFKQKETWPSDEDLLAKTEDDRIEAARLR